MSGFRSQSNTGTGNGPEGGSEEPAARDAPRLDVEAELRAFRAQAQQASTILSDAIAKLGDSFSAIQADTAAQRSVMESLLLSLAEKPQNYRHSDGITGPALGDDISIRHFVTETSAVLRQFTDMLATVSAQSMKTVYRIDDMAVQLEGVFKLVASSNEISQETFMLAVNATIEAAHAGTAGRTFAVIASNVRDLSQRTRRFNDEIEVQIGKAQSTINEVRQIVADMASRDLNVALTGKERVQSMLPNLEAFRGTVAASVDQAGAAGARIAAATSTAVTALQFEDILAQLIGSMVKRAERIGGTDTPEGSDVDPCPPAPLTFGVCEPRNMEAELAVPASDPVHQTDMKPGDVELF